MTYTLHHGDCLEVLATLPDCSVDAIVTDPPAGIAFMGKDWDRDKGGKTEWVQWMQSVASQCRRVIKPGGHALVWAIPRTSHWTGDAWEEAGWQVRDKIYHVFGSGFPKSLDVSKAIDKHGGQSVAWFGPWFRCWREEKGVTQKQVAALFPSKTGGLTGCVANWELGFNMPTPEQFNLIRDAFSLPFESIEAAQREVVGQHKTDMGGLDGERLGQKGGDITAPATAEAKQWAGWGTALKPAAEEWWLFRRPLEGTVAANVLKHGTGAINVDGCRVEPTDESRKRVDEVSQDRRYTESGGTNFAATPGIRGGDPLGRWPANFTHDGSDEVTALLGDAARFFYSPKASKTDRDEGCEGMEARQSDESRKQGNPGGDNPRNRGVHERSNFHPTVKPVDLMTYLCRLITPPGGTILDPFTGSGSTGKAAILEDFHFIGIEREAEYIEIAKARIDAAIKFRSEFLF